MLSVNCKVLFLLFRSADLNECAYDHAFCDQDCENFDGTVAAPGYNCSCVAGYEARGTHCRAINGKSPLPRTRRHQLAFSSAAVSVS